jgi:hypothetical protein
MYDGCNRDRHLLRRFGDQALSDGVVGVARHRRGEARCCVDVDRSPGDRDVDERRRSQVAPSALADERIAALPDVATRR